MKRSRLQDARVRRARGLHRQIEDQRGNVEVVGLNARQERRVSLVREQNSRSDQERSNELGRGGWHKIACKPFVLFPFNSSITPTSPAFPNSAGGMLSRSQRQNLNQENPSHRPGAVHPSKTPARQLLAGPSKPGLTGGKGLGLTAKSGRVLGAKDGNLGKSSSGESRRCDVRQGGMATATATWAAWGYGELSE
jgi:hypothetical protein